MSQGTLTIIIPVRDRCTELQACLASLADQRSAAGFEVIVVDDGSQHAFDAGRGLPFPVTVLRQASLGVASARNLGLRHAHGDTVVFIDSDCIAEPDFLARMAEGLEAHQSDVAFQARLASPERDLLGSIEGLRLAAIQEVTLEPSGHICYANTSGLALRMSYVSRTGDLFDPGAIRGEDTLLLEQLYANGQVPRFVPDARVLHCPRMPWWRYVVKHLSIGYRAGGARRRIAREHAATLTRSARVAMLDKMREISAARGLRRTTLPLTLFAYALEVVGRAADRMVGMRPGRRPVLSCVVDRVRGPELISRITNAARDGSGLRVTYLHAWSLVLAERSPEFSKLLRGFDLVYADGFGVVWTAMLTRFDRVKKVTANDYSQDLLREAEVRRLRVAVIGGREGVAQEAVAGMHRIAPGLCIVGCASGYLGSADNQAYVWRIRNAGVQLVIVGMGQPEQERWVVRHADSLPGVTLLCVGGLLETLAGRRTDPPRWVRRSGFEWLYRFATQPRSTWRRYLLGIPALGVCVVRDILTRVEARLRT